MSLHNRLNYAFTVNIEIRYLGLAEMFIQAGADVNSLTNSHLTPLLSLCRLC